MVWPSRRGLAAALAVGALAGGALALYMRLAGGPVGMGGGDGPRGLVAIGSPAGGGGWITLYRGMDTEPYARTRVPWQAYDDAVGAARPLPLRLARGEQKVLVALDAMHGQEGGWLVVLDGPAGRCRPLAWRRIVLGGRQGAQSLWIAGGDIDGDGLDEVVVGGPQANGEVIVLDDLEHDLAPLATLRVPWSAYDKGCGETRPAVGDLDGDGKAEVVVGLGGFRDKGGWLAAYEGLRFARWVRGPQGGDEKGTWPAIGDVRGEGKGQLVVATRAKIAVLSDPLGSPKSEWIPVPPEVEEESAELVPVCAGLDGSGRSQVLANSVDAQEASAAALFDDATNAHAFLGWRWGWFHMQRLDAAIAAGGLEGSLAALKKRGARVEIAREANGSVYMLFGRLSAPSKLSPVDRAREFLSENQGLWGLKDVEQDLSLDREGSVRTPDDCGTTQVRFRQVVSGVPLLRHGLQVHMDDTGAVTWVNGLVDPKAVGATIDPVPKIDEEGARKVLRDKLQVEYFDPSSLVAWRGNDRVHLTWGVRGASLSKGESREYVVDAHDGTVLCSQDIACDFAQTPGDASQTEGLTWRGNVVPLDIVHFRGDVIFMEVDINRELPDKEMGLYFAPYDWPLPDPEGHYGTRFLEGRRFGGILRTFSWYPPFTARRATAVIGERRQPVGDMSWTVADTNPTRDFKHGIFRGEVDAHWNMTKVLEYWQRFMLRSSYDGGGADVSVIAHYVEVADHNHVHYDWFTHQDGVWARSYKPWAGAQWLGVNGIILCGDGGAPEGGGDLCCNMTSLDLLAHEFTHGVTSATLGLDNVGEAGSINEHLSDALAMFAERRMKSEHEQFTPGIAPAEVDRRRWIIGEEVTCTGRGARNMANPASGGLSPGPDDYRNRAGVGGVSTAMPHYNANILNHWLYLWIHGGAQPSSGVRVNGMGGTPAAYNLGERVYKRMFSALVVPHMNFVDFRDATMAIIAEDARLSVSTEVRNPTSPAGLAAKAAFEAIHLWGERLWVIAPPWIQDIIREAPGVIIRGIADPRAIIFASDDVAGTHVVANTTAAADGTFSLPATGLVGTLYLIAVDRDRGRSVPTRVFLTPPEVLCGGGDGSEGRVMSLIDDGAAGRQPTWTQFQWSTYAGGATAGATSPAAVRVGTRTLLALGLGHANGQGGWVEVQARDGEEAPYGHLAWVRVPDEAYCASGGGTWPTWTDLDGVGQPQLLVSLAEAPRIAVFDGAPGFGFRRWIDVPWTEYHGGYRIAGSPTGNGFVASAGPTGNAWTAVFGPGGILRTWARPVWSAYTSRPDAEVWPALAHVGPSPEDTLVLGFGDGSAGWVPYGRLRDRGWAVEGWARVPWQVYNQAHGQTHPACGGDRLYLGLGHGGAGFLSRFDWAAGGRLFSPKWRRYDSTEYNQQNGETWPTVPWPRNQPLPGTFDPRRESHDFVGEGESNRSRRGSLERAGALPGGLLGGER